MFEKIMNKLHSNYFREMLRKEEEESENIMKREISHEFQGIQEALCTINRTTYR